MKKSGVKNLVAILFLKKEGPGTPGWMQEASWKKVEEKKKEWGIVPDPDPDPYNP